MNFSHALARVIWVAVIVAGVAYATTHINTESSLLKLLPKYQDKTVNDIVSQASAKVNNQLVLMASGKNKADLIQHFSEAIESISQLNLHQEINWKLQQKDAVSLYQTIQSVQQNLVPVADQIMVTDNQAENYFIQQAQEQLYGFQNFTEQQLINDPLLITPRILQSLVGLSSMRFNMESGYFMVENKGLNHIAAFISLREDASKPDFQNKIESKIGVLKVNLEQVDISLYALGAVRYAYHAYQQAKFEISTVGLGSIFGICLLFIWVFRSFSPLLMSLANIGLGLCLGFAVTRFYFGEVHVFAMMFGATIAGLSVDYCFHYFVESGVYGKNTIKRIFPALLTGFLSSALVYSAFILTGYQVLAQIALFSIFGLLTVLLNVTLIFPVIYRGVALTRLHKAAIVGLIYNNPLQRLLSPFVVIALVLVLGALAYFLIKPNDDIRALQSLSPELLKEEQIIRQTLQLESPAQFIVVTAKTADEALYKEAQVLQKLRKVNTDFMGVSDFIPAREQQQINHDFYQNLKTSEQFINYIDTLGLANKLPDKTPFEAISTSSINQDPLNKVLSSRWIGQVDGLYALLIPYGIKEPFHPEQEGVLVVNQVSDISKLLSHYRVESTQVLLISIAVLILLLGLFKYPMLRSTHLVCLPLLAGLVSYHLASLLGFHISLFSVLSLLLILGIGLDYVIFLSEHKDKRRVMLALMLSAITTILAFGLLALSEVAVIKSFGFMIGVGILCLLLFAPAVKYWDNLARKHTRAKT